MLQAERDDWNVSYELGDTWKNARKIKLKNSSLFKIDILVYPVAGGCDGGRLIPFRHG